MFDAGAVSVLLLLITILSFILPFVLLWYTWKAWQRVVAHFDRVESLLERIAGPRS